jgi:hypothetical protein
MEYLYYGLYDKGKYSGRGILYNSHTKQYYEGQFKNGDLEGYGRISTLGYSYRGQFHKSDIHGIGIMYQHRDGYNLLSCVPLRLKYYYTGVYIGIFCKGKFYNGIYIDYDQYNDIYDVTSYFKGKKHGTAFSFSSSFFESQMYQKNQKNGLFTFQDDKIKVQANCINNLFTGIYEIFSKNHYQQLFFRKGIMLNRSLFYYKYKTCFIIQIQKDSLKPDMLYVYHDKAKRKIQLSNVIETYNIPQEYTCPIGHEIMLQPCRTEVGQCYDYKNISKWFHYEKNLRDPMTNVRLYSKDLNFDMYKIMEIFEFICHQYFSKNDLKIEENII